MSSAVTDVGQKLREDGFVVLNDVFSEDELEPRRQLVDEIIEYEKAGYTHPLSGDDCPYLDHRTDQGALYGVFQRHPQFQSMASNNDVLDAVEAILGPHLYLYVNSVVYKPPEGKNEVPMHQDFMSRADESDRYIAWMPLYDATRDNGCLKVVPGTHTEADLEWHRVEGETHHDRLNQDQFDESEIRYLPIDAGDVLVFNQHLVHGSDEVTSEAPRHAFRAVYKAPSKDDIKIPRGGQIMLRGGEPTKLSDSGIDKRKQPDTEEPLPKRALHAIGRRLQEI